MLKRYSKYPFNRNRHPRTAQEYALRTQGYVVLAVSPKSPVWARYPKSAAVGGS
jgi:hypothetical protein